MGRIMRFLGLIGIARSRSFGSECPRSNLGQANPEPRRPQGRCDTPPVQNQMRRQINIFYSEGGESTDDAAFSRLTLRPPVDEEVMWPGIAARPPPRRRSPPLCDGQSAPPQVLRDGHADLAPRKRAAAAPVPPHSEGGCAVSVGEEGLNHPGHQARVPRQCDRNRY